MRGASDPIPPCPRCHATHVARSGRTRAGSPNFLCRGCGRRFVPDPKTGPVPGERREVVRRLPCERVSLRAIARAAGAPRSWLQRFVNDPSRDGTPREPGRLKKGRARS